MSSVQDFVYFLGIDVSKSTLVVHLMGPEGFRPKKKSFPNDSEGVKSLLDWLGIERSQCRVAMEATSRYHRICERALLDAGMRVDLLNPQRSRSLAVGFDILDKEDGVDARVLALVAESLKKKEVQVPSLAAQDLRDHSRMIDTIKQDGGTYLKRMEGLDPESDAYQAAVRAYQAFKELAKSEERRWEKEAKKDSETYRRYTLAKSVDDVGEVTARIVSVELPAELKDLKRLCGYAGLVPKRNQSGNKELPPHIQGGNSYLRTGLYMAGMHSIFQGKRRNSPFYEEIKARNLTPYRKGAAHLKAMVAVMRKLLTNILAVILRNSPWTPEPPRRKDSPPVRPGKVLASPLT